MPRWYQHLLGQVLCLLQKRRTVSQDWTKRPGITGNAGLLPHLLHASRNACETHWKTDSYSGYHVKPQHWLHLATEEPSLNSEHLCSSIRSDSCEVNVGKLAYTRPAMLVPFHYCSQYFGSIPKNNYTSIPSIFSFFSNNNTQIQKDQRQ